MTERSRLSPLPRPLSGAGVFALPLVALLSGCVGIPDVGSRPQTLAAGAVAAERSLSGGADEAGVPVAVWPGEGWWRDYQDPQLDALIAEGLANAPDVAAAAARFRKAGALAGQARAALLPQLDAQGRVGFDKQSLNTGSQAIKGFLPRGWNDGGQVAAALGFDVDVWGRNRAALATATSEARAAAIEAQEARLMLAVGIASAYVDLDRLFAERDVRAHELKGAEDARRLMADRQANGLETRGNAAEAEALAARSRVALSQVDESLVLRRNQLAALLGAGPDRGLELTRPALVAPAPRGVPDGVTTDLVGRRPDVAAARQRVEAAASRIKVARADFFPAIRLDAMFGFQALGLDLLFAKDSAMGSVGPAVSLPIFHGGDLRGRYRGARADYDAAVAGYNGTVLGAYRQTADALTTARMAGQRLADARQAEAASQVAFDVIVARYKGGLATYLEVLQVDQRLLEARLAVAGLEAVVRNADIALVRALGGGFVASPDISVKDPAHG
ncbi:MAG: efflux transporter outer membrane subunit [Sphingomonadales bacterium]|nr:efflux transporter outer membrane subunit [Sphingomonadales bacterium]MBU3993833.1 efflux transporter outer membrane subunit [Alphaproteobacteria bacterium]